METFQRHEYDKRYIVGPDRKNRRDIVSVFIGSTGMPRSFFDSLILGDNGHITKEASFCRFQ